MAGGTKAASRRPGQSAPEGDGARDTPCETARAIRERLAGPVEVVFEVEIFNSFPAKGQEVTVFGASGELGGGSEARGLPTRQETPNLWQTAPVEFLCQRGKVIEPRVNVGPTVRGFHYSVTLPAKARATIRLARGTVTIT